MSKHSKPEKAHLAILKHSSETMLIDDIHRIRNELGLLNVSNHFDDLDSLMSKAPQLLLRLVDAEQALRVAFTMLSMTTSTSHSSLTLKCTLSASISANDRFRRTPRVR